MFGSAVKGITVNAAVNNYATDLLKDWLLKTFPSEQKDENGETHIVQVPNLYAIRNRAFLEELTVYGPEANTDRISAMSQVMLYREHFIVMYGGSPSSDSYDSKDVSDDEFFDRDWNNHLSKINTAHKSIL